VKAITRERAIEAIAVTLVIWGFIGLHGRITSYMMTFDAGQWATVAKILTIGVILATGIIFGFGTRLPKFARKGTFLVLSYLAFFRADSRPSLLAGWLAERRARYLQ